MKIFKGTKSSWSGDPIWPFGSNYKKIIKNNLDRDASVYEPASWTDNNLYIQCNKDRYFPGGGRDCGDKVVAFTWNNPGFYWTDHYMTYCPPFFASSSLSDDIKAAQSGQKNTKIMENFQDNRGVTFFHETFHMIYTVSDPFGMAIIYLPFFAEKLIFIVGDGPNRDTYGAQKAYELARDQNAGSTYVTGLCL